MTGSSPTACIEGAAIHGRLRDHTDDGGLVQVAVLFRGVRGWRLVLRASGLGFRSRLYLPLEPSSRNMARPDRAPEAMYSLYLMSRGLCCEGG